MKFKNYCLIVIGNNKDVLAEIERVSETKPNALGEKGLLIATFSSNFEPSEITEWFKSNERNFMIFDLSPECSGFNFNKSEIQEGLFGFLDKMDLTQKTKDLLSSIENVKEENKLNPKVKELTELDVQSMNSTQKQELFNKILDKGVENFTENDKKIMPLLAK